MKSVWPPFRNIWSRLASAKNFRMADCAHGHTRPCVKSRLGYCIGAQHLIGTDSYWIETEEWIKNGPSQYGRLSELLIPVKYTAAAGQVEIKPTSGRQMHDGVNGGLKDVDIAV